MIAGLNHGCITTTDMETGEGTLVASDKSARKSRSRKFIIH